MRYCYDSRENYRRHFSLYRVSLQPKFDLARLKRLSPKERFKKEKSKLRNVLKNGIKWINICVCKSFEATSIKGMLGSC